MPVSNGMHLGYCKVFTYFFYFEDFWLLILEAKKLLSSSCISYYHSLNQFQVLLYHFLQPVPSADFVVSVDIEGVQHQVYVQKRPHVDEFLRRMGEMFECVLFTASLAKVIH